MTNKLLLNAENNKTSDKIIEATLHEISESGIENLTTKKISQRAETSTGTIHHYFNTKDELVFESYKKLIDYQSEKIEESLQNKHDPIDRIKSIIVGNFNSKFMNKKSARAWTQLWSVSLYNKEVSEVLKSFNKRNFEIIEESLKESLPNQDSRALALNIMSLIHGFWIEILVIKNADLEKSINCIIDFVDNLYKTK